MSKLLKRHKKKIREFSKTLDFNDLNKICHEMTLLFFYFHFYAFVNQKRLQSYLKKLCTFSKMFRFYSEPVRATEVCVYEALATPVKIQAALPLTWGDAGSNAGGGAMESSHEPGWAVSEHVSKPRKMNKSRKKGSERKLIVESENVCEIMLGSVFMEMQTCMFTVQISVCLFIYSSHFYAEKPFSALKKTLFKILMSPSLPSLGSSEMERL